MNAKTNDVGGQGIDWITKWTAVVMSFLTVYLIFRGYPQPFYDDLAVTGAALSLAKGEGFQNPYVRDWMAAFPATKPFFYPPGMSYLLGGWLWLFGISATSMLVFQWGALLGGGAALGWLIHRGFHQPRLIALVSGLAFVLAFQMEGMRNEVLAYAVSFVGLCLCLHQSMFVRMPGYLLIAFSGVIYPTVPVMMMPLYAGLFFVNRHSANDKAKTIFRKLSLEGLLALPGLLISGGLFLWMIGWEPTEFFRVLRIHKRLAIPGGAMAQIEGFIGIITAYSQMFVRLPITIFSILAVLVSIGMSWKSKSNAWIAPTALSVCWVICMLGNPMRARFFAPIIQVAIIMIVLADLWRGKVWFSALGGLMMIGLVNSKTLLSAVLQSPMDEQRINAAREVVRGIDHGKTRVLICPWTARYVYNYNIPHQVIDTSAWTSVTRLEGKPPRILDFSQKAADEIWIGRSEDFYMNSEKSGDGLFVQPDRAKLFGKSLGNIPANQGELLIK